MRFEKGQLIGGIAGVGVRLFMRAVAAHRIQAETAERDLYLPRADARSRTEFSYLHCSM
jgi:hypothetical protein